MDDIEKLVIELRDLCTTHGNADADLMFEKICEVKGTNPDNSMEMTPARLLARAMAVASSASGLGRAALFLGGLDSDAAGYAEVRKTVLLASKILRKSAEIIDDAMVAKFDA